MFNAREWLANGVQNIQWRTEIEPTKNGTGRSSKEIYQHKRKN